MTTTIESTPLYRFVAFGLTNEWVLAGIANGTMSEWCKACQGRRVVVTSPCRWRDAPDTYLASHFAQRCPGKLEGCPECRRPCRECKGTGLLPPLPLMREDFGDNESLRVARRLFHVLPSFEHDRADLHPGGRL